MATVPSAAVGAEADTVSPRSELYLPASDRDSSVGEHLVSPADNHVPSEVVIPRGQLADGCADLAVCQFGLSQTVTSRGRHNRQSHSLIMHHLCHGRVSYSEGHRPGRRPQPGGSTCRMRPGGGQAVSRLATTWFAAVGWPSTRQWGVRLNARTGRRSAPRLETLRGSSAACPLCARDSLYDLPILTRFGESFVPAMATVIGVPVGITSSAPKLNRRVATPQPWPVIR
jgi:hypothetical protein